MFRLFAAFFLTLALPVSAASVTCKELTLSIDTTGNFTATCGTTTTPTTPTIPSIPGEPAIPPSGCPIVSGLRIAPVPSPNAGTLATGLAKGSTVAVTLPKSLNVTRLRVFNSSQTDSSLTTTFALSKCPGEVKDTWSTSGLAPCKKQAGFTGNSLDLTSQQAPSILGIEQWGGKCGWLVQERNNQWYLNIRIDNCDSGACQLNYQVDASGTGF